MEYNGNNFVTYTLANYIASQCGAHAKVIAIEALIDKMIVNIAEYADDAGTHIGEYQLDDGQVKIRTSFRSVADIEAGISALRKMLNIYTSQLNGRAVVLRDNKALR